MFFPFFTVLQVSACCDLQFLKHWQSLSGQDLLTFSVHNNSPAWLHYCLRLQPLTSGLTENM
jgi:hypothetical protein